MSEAVYRIKSALQRMIDRNGWESWLEGGMYIDNGVDNEREWSVNFHVKPVDEDGEPILDAPSLETVEVTMRQCAVPTDYDKEEVERARSFAETSFDNLDRDEMIALLVELTPDDELVANRRRCLALGKLTSGT